MPQARPHQVYDFTAFSVRTPTQQQPGDRLDAQFKQHADAIVEIQLALADLDRKLAVQLTAKPRALTLSSPTLYVNAGGPYAGDDAGATATSADYAQVSIDWAEHMPDIIPPNTLAINAITGDHWSSRWWANRALLLCQAVLAAGFNPDTAVFAEQLDVTGANSLTPLSNAPLDPLSTMQLIVNGRVFCGCAVPPPFTVSGTVVAWTSAIYGLNPGDEVIARYVCAVGDLSS